MKRILFLLLIIPIALLVLSPPVQAQTYEVAWWKVAGGGGDSAGGNYRLSGTLGQPDAGVLSGGNFTLVGGFWAWEMAGQHFIYLPLVIRN